MTPRRLRWEGRRWSRAHSAVTTDGRGQPGRRADGLGAGCGLRGGRARAAGRAALRGTGPGRRAVQGRCQAPAGPDRGQACAGRRAQARPAARHRAGAAAGTREGGRARGQPAAEGTPAGAPRLQRPRAADARARSGGVAVDRPGGWHRRGDERSRHDVRAGAPAGRGARADDDLAHAGEADPWLPATRPALRGRDVARRARAIGAGDADHHGQRQDARQARGLRLRRRRPESRADRRPALGADYRAHRRALLDGRLDPDHRPRPDHPARAAGGGDRAGHARPRRRAPLRGRVVGAVRRQHVALHGRPDVQLRVQRRARGAGGAGGRLLVPGGERAARVGCDRDAARGAGDRRRPAALRPPPRGRGVRGRAAVPDHVARRRR